MRFLVFLKICNVSWDAVRIGGNLWAALKFFTHTNLWFPFAATFISGGKKKTQFSCIVQGCAPALALGPSSHCQPRSLLWAPGNNSVASSASTHLCLRGWDRYFLPWFVLTLLSAQFLSEVVAVHLQIDIVWGSSVLDLDPMDQTQTQNTDQVSRSHS